MKNKNTSIVLSLTTVLLLFAGCATNTAPVPSSAIPVGATDWVVMDPPRPSPRVTYPDPATGSDVTKAWAQLTNAEIFRILSNTRSEISIGRFESGGKVTYLVAQATGEVGTYRVIMDYTPYMVADAIDPATKQKIGDARVGVGLRLTATVTTTKADVNLGSLLALGVAANLKQIRGTMTVESLGIRLAGSGGPILSNTTIDETSIQKTLEAIAVIQSKITDATTHLDPQVLWVKPISGAVKPQQVAAPLM